MAGLAGINHFRQTVQGLWAKHHINLGCPFTDLITFLAGNAAANADDQVRVLFFQFSPATQLVEELFLGFFPHGTGVHQQDIRLFRVVRQLQGMGLTEQIGHTGGIVLVHLATMGFDIQFFAHITLYWLVPCGAQTCGEVKPVVHKPGIIATWHHGG